MFKAPVDYFGSSSAVSRAGVFSLVRRHYSGGSRRCSDEDAGHRGFRRQREQCRGHSRGLRRALHVIGLVVGYWAGHCALASTRACRFRPLRKPGLRPEYVAARTGLAFANFVGSGVLLGLAAKQFGGSLAVPIGFM